MRRIVTALARNFLLDLAFTVTLALLLAANASAQVRTIEPGYYGGIGVEMYAAADGSLLFNFNGCADAQFGYVTLSRVGHFSAAGVYDFNPGPLQERMTVTMPVVIVGTSHGPNVAFTITDGALLSVSGSVRRDRPATLTLCH